MFSLKLLIEYTYFEFFSQILISFWIVLYLFLMGIFSWSLGFFFLYFFEYFCFDSKESLPIVEEVSSSTEVMIGTHRIVWSSSLFSIWLITCFSDSSFVYFIKFWFSYSCLSYFISFPTKFIRDVYIYKIIKRK